LPAAETDCPALGTPNRALGHTLDSTPPSNRPPTLDPCAQQDPHGASDPAPAPTDRPRRRGLEAVGTVSRQTEVGLVAAPHPRFERRCLDTGPHPCVHDVLHAAFPLAGRAGWRDPPHNAPGGGGGAPGESEDQATRLAFKTPPSNPAIQHYMHASSIPCSVACLGRCKLL